MAPNHRIYSNFEKRLTAASLIDTDGDDNDSLSAFSTLHHLHITIHCTNSMSEISVFCIVSMCRWGFYVCISIFMYIHQYQSMKQVYTRIYKKKSSTKHYTIGGLVAFTFFFLFLFWINTEIYCIVGRKRLTSQSAILFGAERFTLYFTPIRVTHCDL